MPPMKKRLTQTKSLQNTLSRYQAQVIIPHCRRCLKPCCNLTEVVLDFDWRHLVPFYQIDLGQHAFDRSLRDGSGPAHIRKQDGLYYAHGSPCPAYNSSQRRCNYYQSSAKPSNCSDFPIYLDGLSIVADKRCEAVNETDLLNALTRIFTGRRFNMQTNRQFPQLVYIDM